MMSRSTVLASIALATIPDPRNTVVKVAFTRAPLKLTAPTSTSILGSSTASLAVVGPQFSSNTAGAGFINGASNTQVSGAVYFPNGPVFMSGAATLHGTVDLGACLELIGTQVTATAGTALGSTCSGLGSGSTGTTIGLVQ